MCVKLKKCMSNDNSLLNRIKMREIQNSAVSESDELSYAN